MTASHSSSEVFTSIRSRRKRLFRVIPVEVFRRVIILGLVVTAVVAAVSALA